MSDDDTPNDTCQKCGREPDTNEMLIPLEIPLTGEVWDLCDPCIDDLVQWIESDS